MTHLQRYVVSDRGWRGRQRRRGGVGRPAEGRGQGPYASIQHRQQQRPGEPFLSPFPVPQTGRRGQNAKRRVLAATATNPFAGSSPHETWGRSEQKQTTRGSEATTLRRRISDCHDGKDAGVAIARCRPACVGGRRSRSCKQRTPGSQAAKPGYLKWHSGWCQILPEMPPGSVLTVRAGGRGRSTCFIAGNGTGGAGRPIPQLSPAYPAPANAAGYTRRGGAAGLYAPATPSTGLLPWPAFPGQPGHVRRRPAHPAPPG